MISPKKNKLVPSKRDLSNERSAIVKFSKFSKNELAVLDVIMHSASPKRPIDVVNSLQKKFEETGSGVTLTVNPVRNMLNKLVDKGLILFAQNSKGKIYFRPLSHRKGRSANFYIVESDQKQKKQEE